MSSDHEQPSDHKQPSAEVVEYTDPICSWAWGTEPKLRLLQWRFASRMRWRVVLGGLVHEEPGSAAPSARGRDRGTRSGSTGWVLDRLRLLPRLAPSVAVVVNNNGDSRFDDDLYDLKPFVCRAATIAPTRLWPANHKFVSVTISGVTDPDNDPVTTAVTAVFQLPKGLP